MLDESIRQQLNKKKKARRWRALRSIFILVLVVGSVWELWRYIHDPSFAFGSIQINGSRQLTQNEVLKMCGQGLPVNILNLNVSKIGYALNHDSRFIKGECRYRWPGVLEITLVERVPAIYVQDNYGSYVKVDYGGMVMSVTKGIPDYSAPVLLNETIENVFVGDSVKAPRIVSVLNFLRGITFDACQDFAEIKIDEYNNLQIILKSGVKFVVGILEEVEDKGRIFMSVYGEVKDRALDVEYVDMRFTKPYLRMRSGKSFSLEK